MKDNIRGFTVPQDQADQTGKLAVLRAAILAEQSVLFNYDGEPRLAEIHSVGLTKKGKLSFRAWQSAGGSNTGTPEWRLFTLEKVENLALTHFPSYAPRKGYKEGDSALPDILYEVETEA